MLMGGLVMGGSVRVEGDAVVMQGPSGSDWCFRQHCLGSGLQSLGRWQVKQWSRCRVGRVWGCCFCGASRVATDAATSLCREDTFKWVADCCVCCKRKFYVVADEQATGGNIMCVSGACVGHVWQQLAKVGQIYYFMDCAKERVWHTIFGKMYLFPEYFVWCSKE